MVYEVAEKLERLTGEYSLSTLIEHHTGMIVKDARPTGGVLKLKTDHGSFALKRIRPGEKNRWKLLDQFARHLEETSSGDVRIQAPIPMRSGKLWFEGTRYSYVLLPWIEGKTVRLDRVEEWKDASRELARLHVRSSGFEPALSDDRLQISGHWQKKWEQDHEQMHILRLAAKWTSNPSETDRAWMEIARYSMGIMENLFRYYEKIGGDSTVRRYLTHGNVCHGRLHRKNILRDSRGDVRFIDWNEISLDAPHADLAAWLSYAYGRTGSLRVMSEILKGYGEERPLAEEEYALLYARMLYPESLVRMLKNVYLGESADSDGSAVRVSAASRLEQNKGELLSAFADLVRHEFHVTVPEIDWMRTSVSRQI
ncbi:phosphotransferase [Staphylospora marina]|uniref:phosphotransferase n=1 Tax=Staphylospora marina TaxID=2490858 RepID=UPI000F5BE153|nr:phosphotransferase [Staphylospora marina]